MNDKTLRKVIVSHMVKRQQGGHSPPEYVLEPQGEALFHQFGVGYDEFEAGPGNYTTAIVEWPDGRIESVVTDRVRFVPHNADSGTKNHVKETPTVDLLRLIRVGHLLRRISDRLSCSSRHVNRRMNKRTMEDK